MQVGAGLEVHRQAIGAGLFEGFGKFLRFLDHQVDIEGFGGGLSDLGDHGEPEADIWNEPSVHHIQVKPVCLAFIQHLAFLLQTEKIRGQQGGSDDCHSFGFLIASFCVVSF